MKTAFILMFILAITSLEAADQVEPTKLEPIKPFVMEWNDSLPVAAEKLCKTDGLEICDFEMGHFNKFSLRKLDAKKIEDVIKKSVKDLFKGFNDFQKNQVIETKFASFPDKDSKEAFWLQGHITLTASPVIVQGVSFIVKTKFMLHPGVNLNSPEKIIWIDGYKRMAVPAYIETVELTALNGTVEQHKSIYEMLKKKYKFDDGNSFPSDSSRDSQGNTLRFAGVIGNCIITYNGSYAVAKEIQEAFMKFNAELKSKGKKDLGGSL